MGKKVTFKLLNIKKMTEQKIQKVFSEWQKKNTPKNYGDEYYFNKRVKTFFKALKSWKKSKPPKSTKK